MGRRRIEMFQYRIVLTQIRQGATDREIARSHLLGRRKTAELRALAERQGWLEPQASLPDDEQIAQELGTSARRAASTISTLQSHRDRIKAWIEQGANGKVILAALQRNHDYRGSYSSLHRMIVSIRGTLPVDVTVPLDFAPGEAAQVDFGAGPVLVHPDGRPRRTWAFVMTLCFSRHQYVEFVWDQTVATWLGCHRRAFEWFCGVPSRVIIDNAKCAVIKACRYDPLVQRAYAECAEGYAFKIDPCPVRDPQKKGVVEAGVKYVKSNFLPLRQFRDLADLNAQARAWATEHAGTRVHGTTHQPPLARFELERAQLRPLPAMTPDLGTWHQVKVHRDCHVAHERMLYSVPFTMVGQVLWLRATDSTVTLYREHRLVATHPRGRHPGQRSTLRDHLPPAAQAYFAHDRDWCVRRAGEVGAACAELVQRMLADHIVERLRAAQGVLRLCDRYGHERVEAACARALFHASPFFRTVKTILAGGYDQQPLTPVDAQRAHVPGARFARTAQSLFDPDATRH